MGTYVCLVNFMSVGNSSVSTPFSIPADRCDFDFGYFYRGLERLKVLILQK